MQRQPRMNARAGRNFTVRPGFTLLEMMLVVVIIALIAGTLVPVITRPQMVDQLANTQQTLYAVVDAIMGRSDLGMPGFVGAMGRLPASASNPQTIGIDELIARPVSDGPPLAPAQGGLSSGWVGPFLLPYVPNPSTDGWGNQFQIFPQPNDNSGHWCIISPGPDGVLGTNDDIGLPDNTCHQAPPSNPPNDYFNTIGQVTFDLFMTRQGVVAPLPDSFLIGNTPNMATPVLPTVYLPSLTDGKRTPCKGPSAASNCPGVCTVVDSSPASSGGPKAITSPRSLTGLTPPFRIACNTIPYGTQHISIPIQDPITQGVLTTPTVELNFTVTQPFSSVRALVPYQQLAETTCGSFNGGVSACLGFTTATIPVTAPTTGVPATIFHGQILTLPAISGPVGQTAYSLAFRVQGIVEVTASGASCTFNLFNGSTALTGVAVTSPSAAATSTAPADQPFMYDLSLPVNYNTPVTLNNFTFKVTATPSSACKVTSAFGTVTRLFEP